MGPLKLDALVAAILSAPKPVLLLDTCVYLDFLNKALDPQSPYGLKKIVEMNDVGAIHIITPELITDEFSRNVTNVEERAKKSIDRLVGEVEGVRAHLQAFAALDKGDKLPAYLTAGAGKRLVDVVAGKVRRLLDTSSVFELTPEIKLRAHERQLSARRPARRGKDSSGDCSIIEALLEVALRLRSGGFADRIVFISSNVEDFGGEDALTRRRLHPALRLEFYPFTVEFFSSVNGAASTFPP